MANSFTQHFEYDEDDDGPKNASASEEIHKGVADGG
jgi:hypothetical protein